MIWNNLIAFLNGGRAKIVRFEVTIYEHSLFAGQGQGDDFQEYLTVNSNGFNGSCIFSLEDEWSHILRQRITTYQTDVTGYETIRKLAKSSN